MSTQNLIVRNNCIETAEMDGEIGMLNIETGQYYLIDGIGSDIWRLLEEPKSMSVLVGELLKMYNVDDEECRRDTEAFVVEMQALGLILDSE